MHVGGKHLLRYPGHVLAGPDVDLGHLVRRVLVQHHGDVARVLAPPHVLLVRALCKWLVRAGTRQECVDRE